MTDKERKDFSFFLFYIICTLVCSFLILSFLYYLYSCLLISHSFSFLEFIFTILLFEFMSISLNPISLINSLLTPTQWNCIVNSDNPDINNKEKILNQELNDNNNNNNSHCSSSSSPFSLFCIFPDIEGFHNSYQQGHIHNYNSNDNQEGEPQSLHSLTVERQHMKDIYSLVLFRHHPSKEVIGTFTHLCYSLWHFRIQSKYWNLSQISVCINEKTVYKQIWNYADDRFTATITGLKSFSSHKNFIDESNKEILMLSASLLDAKMPLIKNHQNEQQEEQGKIQEKEIMFPIMQFEPEHPNAEKHCTHPNIVASFIINPRAYWQWMRPKVMDFDQGYGIYDEYNDDDNNERYNQDKEKKEELISNSSANMTQTQILSTSREQIRWFSSILMNYFCEMQSSSLPIHYKTQINLSKLLDYPVVCIQKSERILTELPVCSGYEMITLYGQNIYNLFTGYNPFCLANIIYYQSMYNLLTQNVLYSRTQLFQSREILSKEQQHPTYKRDCFCYDLCKSALSKQYDRILINLINTKEICITTRIWDIKDPWSNNNVKKETKTPLLNNSINGKPSLLFHGECIIAEMKNSNSDVIINTNKKSSHSIIHYNALADPNFNYTSFQNLRAFPLPYPRLIDVAASLYISHDPAVSNYRTQGFHGINGDTVQYVSFKEDWRCNNVYFQSIKYLSILNDIDKKQVKDHNININNISLHPELQIQLDKIPLLPLNHRIKNMEQVFEYILKKTMGVFPFSPFSNFINLNPKSSNMKPFNETWISKMDLHHSSFQMDVVYFTPFEKKINQRNECRLAVNNYVGKQNLLFVFWRQKAWELWNQSNQGKHKIKSYPCPQLVSSFSFWKGDGINQEEGKRHLPWVVQCLLFLPLYIQYCIGYYINYIKVVMEILCMLHSESFKILISAKNYFGHYLESFYLKSKKNKLVNLQNSSFSQCSSIIPSSSCSSFSNSFSFLFSKKIKKNQDHICSLNTDININRPHHIQITIPIGYLLLRLFKTPQGTLSSSTFIVLLESCKYGKETLELFNNKEFTLVTNILVASNANNNNNNKNNLITVPVSLDTEKLCLLSSFITLPSQHDETNQNNQLPAWKILRSKTVYGCGHSQAVPLFSISGEVSRKWFDTIEQDLDNKEIKQNKDKNEQENKEEDREEQKEEEENLDEEDFEDQEQYNLNKPIVITQDIIINKQVQFSQQGLDSKYDFSKKNTRWSTLLESSNFVKVHDYRFLHCEKFFSFISCLGFMTNLIQKSILYKNQQDENQSYINCTDHFQIVYNTHIENILRVVPVIKKEEEQKKDEQPAISSLPNYNEISATAIMNTFPCVEMYDFDYNALVDRVREQYKNKDFALTIRDGSLRGYITPHEKSWWLNNHKIELPIIELPFTPQKGGGEGNGTGSLIHRTAIHTYQGQNNSIKTNTVSTQRGNNNYMDANFDEENNLSVSTSTERLNKNSRKYLFKAAELEETSEPCIVKLELEANDITIVGSSNVDKCRLSGIRTVWIRPVAITRLETEKGIEWKMGFKHDYEKTTCGICKTYWASCLLRPCKHKICSQCWITHSTQYKNNCPFCRKSIEGEMELKMMFQPRDYSLQKAYSFIDVKQGRGVYEFGKRTEAPDYDRNRNKLCSNGIHACFELEDTAKWFEYHSSFLPDIIEPNLQLESELELKAHAKQILSSIQEENHKKGQVNGQEEEKEENYIEEKKQETIVDDLLTFPANDSSSKLTQEDINIFKDYYSTNQNDNNNNNNTNKIISNENNSNNIIEDNNFNPKIQPPLELDLTELALDKK